MLKPKTAAARVGYMAQLCKRIDYCQTTGKHRRDDGDSIFTSMKHGFVICGYIVFGLHSGAELQCVSCSYLPPTGGKIDQ